MIPKVNVPPHCPKCYTPKERGKQMCICFKPGITMSRKVIREHHWYLKQLIADRKERGC